MRGVAVVIQVLISLFVAATLMPVLLVSVPAMQSSSVGPGVAVVLAGLTFVVVRIVWPRHRA